MHASPTEFVKVRLGNAGTHDQVPETIGAASGRTLFRNGATVGREFKP